MEKEMQSIENKDIYSRKKRVKRLKRILIIIFIILLILPTILSVIMFWKISSLERQIDVLRLMHQEEYDEYAKKITYENGQVVYAAELKNPKESTDDSSSLSYNKDLELEQTEQDSKNSNTTKDKEQVHEEQNDYITNGKKVYLTFDDGPSKNTDEILEILSNYNVKATFFVTGKTDDASKELYKKIIREGHTLGMHSYSHQYSQIYSSLESFKEDLEQLSNLLYDVTGVKPMLYRFPGGSSNTVSDIPMDELITYLNESNITYFDWNVSSEDASSILKTGDEILNNVLSGVERFQSSVVLMHDSTAKESTVEALPQIIEQLNKDGCEILPITEDVTPIQHKMKTK